MPEQPQSLESQLQLARPRRHEVKRVPLTPEEKEFLGKIMDNAVAAEKAGKLKEALDFYTDYKNELMKIKDRKENKEPRFNVEFFDFKKEGNIKQLIEKKISKVALTSEAKDELFLNLNKYYLEGFDLKEFRKRSDKSKEAFFKKLPIFIQIVLEVEGIDGLLIGTFYTIDEMNEEFKWHIVSNIEPYDILKKDELGVVKDIQDIAAMNETRISFDSGAKILFGAKYEDETGYTTVFFSEK